MDSPDPETDISDSVAISALIAAVATGLVYVEFWGGSLPPTPGTLGLIGAIGGGLAAGGFFYYSGTRSTPLDDLPAFGILLVLTAVVVFVFPDGLPIVAEIGIVVAVWTDTALRAIENVA